MARFTGLGQMRFALAAGVIGMGVFITFFSLSAMLWLALAMALVVGFFFQMLMTANFALLQVLVPDRLRGRVMSVRFIIFGSRRSDHLAGRRGGGDRDACSDGVVGGSAPGRGPWRSCSSPPSAAARTLGSRIPRLLLRAARPLRSRSRPSRSAMEEAAHGPAARVPWAERQSRPPIRPGVGQQ